MTVTNYYLVFLRYKYRSYNFGLGVLFYIRRARSLSPATERTSTDNDNNTQLADYSLC